MNTIGLTTTTADRKRRAGQRLVVGLSRASLTDEERSFIRDARPGGFILFARNVEEPAQVRELNRELASLLPDDVPPLRTVDQEGGRVQRVRAPATVWPPARWVGNVGDPAFTRRVSRALARELRAMEFDLDFAPVADVHSNPANPVIGDRSYGTCAASVAEHVVAALEGMTAEGIGACVKHFPGHGDTAVDSHLDLPTVEKDPPDLDAMELAPFRAAVRAGVGSVMTAHVMYPGWDETYPATMSSTILRGQLRGRLGFSGVVFSDDLEMKAVRGRWPLSEQLLRASDASVDVFLVCSELALAWEAWEGLVRLQEDDPRQDDAAIAAVRRWSRLRESILIDRAPAPGLDVLADPAHQELALRARVEGASA